MTEAPPCCRTRRSAICHRTFPADLPESKHKNAVPCRVEMSFVICALWLYAKRSMLLQTTTVVPKNNQNTRYTLQSSDVITGHNPVALSFCYSLFLLHFAQGHTSWLRFGRHAGLDTTRRYTCCALLRSMPDALGDHHTC